MSDDTCRFSHEDQTCEKPVEVRIWQLCKPHYSWMRYRGLLVAEARDESERCSKPRCKYAAKVLGLCRPHLAEERAAGRLPGHCEFRDCEQPRHGEEYCRSHMNQLERGIPLSPLRQKDSRTGTCPGEAGECGRLIRARGMCTSHYYQWSEGKPLTAIGDASSNQAGLPCAVCAKYGETRKARTNDGLCQSHYERKRHGQPDWDRQVKPKAANGTRVRKDQPYRRITVNGRSRMEHTFVAEQLLGRPLTPNENVHHVNGNRADNRTDGPFVMDERGRMRSGNLEVWSTAQPAGQEIGPKLGWAAELFDQYGQFDLNVARRVAARSISILGQLGTVSEQKACAVFSRLSAVELPVPVVEPGGSLF